MPTLRKLSRALATLRMEGMNFEECVQTEVLHILKNFGNKRDLKEMSPHISQALNFFIINTFESEITARNRIAIAIFEKGSARSMNSAFDKNLNPSKLVAGVAYLFRRISLISFCRGFHGSDEEFQNALINETSVTSEHVNKLFPENKEYWDAFMQFFTKKYLSPWNEDRYSNFMTRANFGTGVDYITIP